MARQRKNTASSSEATKSEVAKQAKIKDKQPPSGGIHSGAASKASALQQVVVAQTAQSAQGGGKDFTRHRLALVYVASFLGIIAATLSFMFWQYYPIDEIKDILLAESAILSGPLGFIIGFYFKEEFEKKDNP